MTAHRLQWWPSWAAIGVLVVGYILGGASNTSSASPLVGTPTHPQILSCYEEATHFTGSVAPIGAAGHWVRTRVFSSGSPAGNHESTQRGSLSWSHRVQTPSGCLSGSHGDTDNCPQGEVLRRATEPMVGSTWEPVSDVPCLCAQAWILSAELSVHRRSSAGLRSTRRASRRSPQDEPCRSLTLCGTMHRLMIHRYRTVGLGHRSR